MWWCTLIYIGFGEFLDEDCSGVSCVKFSGISGFLHGFWRGIDSMEFVLKWLIKFWDDFDQI